MTRCRHTAAVWAANTYGLQLDGLEAFGKSNGRDSATYKWMRLFPSPHVNVNGMSYKQNGDSMMSSYDMACRFRDYRVNIASMEALEKISEEHQAAMKVLGIWEAIRGKP